MNLKDPKTVVRNLYQKYIHKEENVIYVDKIFIINTIINFLFAGKTYKELDQFQIARYGEYIHRFLQDEVDIFWKDGRLIIRDLQSGKYITGG